MSANITEQYDKWHHDQIKQLSSCLVADISTIVMSYLDLYREYITRFDSFGQFMTFGQAVKDFNINLKYDIISLYEPDDILIGHCINCNKTMCINGSDDCFYCHTDFCLCSRVTNLHGHDKSIFNYHSASCLNCEEYYCIQCNESSLNIKICPRCIEKIVVNSKLYKDLSLKNNSVELVDKLDKDIN